jgi:hypothetical protein
MIAQPANGRSSEIISGGLLRRLCYGSALAFIFAWAAWQGLHLRLIQLPIPILGAISRPLCAN